MKRRDVLSALGLSALGAASLGGLALAVPRGQTGEMVPSRVPLPRPFRVPLPIPAVARPVRTDAATDYYEIVQRAADQEILPGVRTRVLGYDGTFPGPTLVTRSGRRAVVTHRNDLPGPVAVHLHGGHTPADSDGYPTDLIQPGGRRDYTYPTRQRAATLWYHDHRMDFTGPQVYRGLAGFHLVTDDEQDALGLPSGERDVPLMISDRSFDEDGSFSYPASHHGAGVDDAHMEGVLGDVVLVNGAPWPVLEVAAVRYRLRLLNASNARRYRLGMDPARTPLVQIASDGGLLEKPIEHSTVLLAPGERCELVVDFAAFPPGTEITLRNSLGSGGTADVMRFRVTGRGRDNSRIPPQLSRIEPLSAERAVRTRTWTFRRSPTGEHPGWLLDGRAFDPERIDADVRLGEIEVWRFTSDLYHPVHVHLDPFQVLSRRGDGPGPHDQGWKDTVDLAPSESVDVAVRFTDYPGRYLLHCHNLEHEDMAMMAAFRTT
ncbi:multicopper oxidase family protein [Dactylosporangium maewongense]|uniref:Multicopper oxidase family protein n=1 Tax=Dactylosporangium maewongense TaxID=634393 RepID=A0ABP4NKD8_9ACTN